MKNILLILFFTFTFIKVKAQCDPNFSVTLNVTNATSSSSADGSIYYMVNGGTPPYVYSWSNGSPATNPITGLPIGTYSVTVIDANGCTTVESATITEVSPTNLYVTLSPTDVHCYGANDGSITINTIVGGTPPYTYIWSNGDTASSLANLAPSVYTLTVTDANNNTASTTTIVNQPDSVWVSISTNNVSTVGGSDGIIDLDVYNAMPMLSDFVWNNPAIDSATVTGSIWVDAYGRSYTFYDLPAGTYNATFTYGAGCGGTINATITEPTCNALFSVFPDSSAAHTWTVNNLSASYNPLSYMWFWGDGDSTAGVAPSHTYSSAGYFNICLRVSDGLGCEDLYCDSSTYIFKTEEVITVNVVDKTQTPTGISDTKNNHSISFYPNPSNGKFTLTSDISQSGMIDVYNITGAKVFSQNTSSLTRANIDISQQAKGIYLVKVSNTENVWTQRVVVE